jgi:hypothetical protein
MSEETRGALHRERFAKLQSEFSELMEMGAAGPEDFKTVAFRLLKAFEVTRLKNHAEIDKMRQQIAFCEATQRACDMFENLLIGVIEAHKNEKKQHLETKVLDSDGNPIRLAEDVLKTICACGCLDEDDIKNCKCSCHQGIPCDNPVCVVCSAKKIQAETLADETNSSQAVISPETGLKPKRVIRKKKVD